MATASSSAADNQHITSVDDVADTDRSRRTARPRAGTSSQASNIRVLFVGKRPTIRRLLKTLPTEHQQKNELDHAVACAKIGEDGRIQLTIVSNQKDALIQVDRQTLHAILVELEYHPRSRVQFCHSLRTREPSMEIVAVGRVHPDADFRYDGELPLPLTVEDVAEVAARFDCESNSGVVVQGPFRLNTVTRVLNTPRGEYTLTPKLAALLSLLLNRHDEVINRGELMEAVWETDFLGDTRTLDVHVRWLRQHIEADPSAPKHLLTVRGEGYQLITDRPSIDA